MPGGAAALLRLAGLRLDEGVEDPLLSGVPGACLDLGDAVVVDLGDRLLEEVANDRLDVAADVSDLGELGRLHLEEGRAGQPGEPPGDLRLPHPGGADHEDVLGDHLLAHRLGQALAAEAVAERDRDGTLGALLADDELVEPLDDLGGPQVVDPRRRLRRRRRAGVIAVTGGGRPRGLAGHRTQRQGGVGDLGGLALAAHGGGDGRLGVGMVGGAPVVLGATGTGVAHGTAPPTTWLRSASASGSIVSRVCTVMWSLV